MAKPPVHQNLTKAQRTALKELKEMVKDRVLRISPADKGGAVIVQDFAKYQEEALRQLNNTVHYKRLQEDPTVEIARRSNLLLKKLHEEGTIDEKTYEWGLVNEKTVQTHTFYHVPKIHKNRESPPGRPIVSGIGGPTERLSKLVDHWLQPVVQRLPSYLKDTTHFLQIIEEWKSTMEPISEDTLIATIDVVALYPSIPHEDVETSLTETLECYAKETDNLPAINTMLQVVKNVLNNNVFEYEGEIYQQIQGTAMGTPMAPAIANIFMGWMEQRLLRTSPWSVDPQHWRRFIDDILVIWQHGEERLNQFIKWLNEQHKTIKFTCNYGKTNIPFLDVSMSIKNGRIDTDVYRKPTDVNMLLPFHSSHPRHCMRGIPYGQCLRLRRICSQDDVFQNRCKELQLKLCNRGYPKSLVESVTKKVSAIPREQTLRYTKRPNNADRVPFVITHNPSHPPLAKWLKDLMPSLHTSRRMKLAMPKPPIVGERNSSNLRRMLMPSRPPAKKTQQEPGCFKCEATRCVLCEKHLMETKTFTSTRTGHTYHIREQVNCKSKNVIYLVDCAKCREVQYVGETGQTVSKRFHGHRSDIKRQPKTAPGLKDTIKRESLVARHFQSTGHSVDHLRVTVIEQITVTGQRADQVRVQRERFWRHKLKTMYPSGLNVWD